MVVTVLEAQVAPEETAALEKTFKQAVEQLDAGIVQTFLLQNAKEPNIWQIVTVWESREALDAMRQSGETPRGVLIFRSAKAEPRLSILKVLSHVAA